MKKEKTMQDRFREKFMEGFCKEPLCMKITFPSKTAKQIITECDNKLGTGKFLWDISWYKDEDFYTKEKCRKGTREVSFSEDSYGDTWNQSKQNGEMLNFAELLWYVKCYYEENRKFPFEYYSWTSSRDSDGRFVDAGRFGDRGGDVYRLRPDNSGSAIGCAFSEVVADARLGRGDSIEPLNIEEAVKIVKENGYVLFKIEDGKLIQP